MSSALLLASSLCRRHRTCFRHARLRREDVRRGLAQLVGAGTVTDDLGHARRTSIAQGLDIVDSTIDETTLEIGIEREAIERRARRRYGPRRRRISGGWLAWCWSVRG